MNRVSTAFKGANASYFDLKLYLCFFAPHFYKKMSADQKGIHGLIEEKIPKNGKVFLPDLL